MLDSITKRPDEIQSLPPLPPFLQPKRRGKDRFLIIPDIRFIEHRDVVRSQSNNWISIIYRWMIKVESDSLIPVDTAHTSMRKYRQWLETSTQEDGIPPHIQFGGCIISGEADPTFKSRWIDYAQKLFV